MSNITEPVSRIQIAAESIGLQVAVKILSDSARTAEEAAVACGCPIGAIVKSLVFRGVSSGQAVLLLVSGVNRVDEAKVGAMIGEAIERPNAAFVRETTGFAIGGIPPFGHRAPLATWLDQDLLGFPLVWAAAGTPHAVFAVDPMALRDAIGATVMAMH